MSVGSLIRGTYLLYFSQPAADRAIYQALKRRAIRSIVELGIDLAGRTQRVLEVASWRAPAAIQYAGIDLFESRPAGQPRLALKQAYHELRATGASVRLIPGEPYAALARMANVLAKTDLLLIGQGHDAGSLAAAWRYVPRMIHPQTIIFEHHVATARGNSWRRLTEADIAKLAAMAGKTAGRWAA